MASEGDQSALKEMKLIISRAKDGSDEDTLAIIKACEGFVKKFAYQFSKSCNISTFEDICSIGTLGIIKAIQKYDLTRDVAFTTFAYREIHGTIASSTRPEWSKCHLRSLSLVSGDSEELPPYSVMEETIQDDSADTFKDVTDMLNNEVLYEALKQISENQCEAIIKRYILDQSPEDIALELGTTVSTINNRIYFGKAALKKVLNNNKSLNY